jgi:hypothetical protein
MPAACVAGILDGVNFSPRQPVFEIVSQGVPPALVGIEIVD